MTGAIVASSILFFPAAPFFLFMKGKEVKIPKGTEITAYVNGDTILDRKKFIADYDSSRSDDALPRTEKTEVSKISIRSTPEGADVYIDGKFIGNTPSILNLSSGDHVITIKHSGYKDWERTISASPGGEINVNANLEEIEDHTDD